MFDRAGEGAPEVIREFHRQKSRWLRELWSAGPANHRTWQDFQAAVDRLKAAVEAEGGLIVHGGLRYRMAKGGLALERDVDRGDEMSPRGDISPRGGAHGDAKRAPKSGEKVRFSDPGAGRRVE